MCGAVTGTEKCACSLFTVRNSKTIVTHSRIRRLSPSPAPGPHCVDLMKIAGQLGNNKFRAGYSIGIGMSAGPCDPVAPASKCVSRPCWRFGLVCYVLLAKKRKNRTATKRAVRFVECKNESSCARFNRRSGRTATGSQPAPGERASFRADPVWRSAAIPRDCHPCRSALQIDLHCGRSR